MRKLFLILGVCLVIAGLGTHFTKPDQTSDVPILYWITDANPARTEQVRLFHEWLVDQGHVTESGKPMFELRLDTASVSGGKIVIQGVSGVAADIVSSTYEFTITDYVNIGILEDVTDRAKELGFDLPTTYEAVAGNITVDGRQYAYPCNVGIWSMWVNVDRFKELGMDPPPRHWDFDTFERIGKEFVKRANKPGEKQTSFFCDSPFGKSQGVMVTAMHRSLGLSRFNETLTRSTYDDPRYIQTLKRLHKWMHKDHLYPSAAEFASLSGESGYGGSTPYLFMEGKYGMVCMGRWGLIRLREFDQQPRLSVSAFPDGGYPNMLIGARAAAIYAGSQRKDLASYFLAFLASEPYNRDMVVSADALPPNPQYAQGRDFTHPPQHPNEWGTHEVFRDFADYISSPISTSPYVSQNTTWGAQKFGWDMCMGNMASPEEAAMETLRRVQREIELAVSKSPKLRERYERDLELQAKIDRYREQGKLVPIEWIKNPFYKKYYLEQGWADTSTATPDTTSASANHTRGGTQP